MPRRNRVGRERTYSRVTGESGLTLNIPPAPPGYAEFVPEPREERYQRHDKGGYKRDYRFPKNPTQ